MTKPSTTAPTDRNAEPEIIVSTESRLTVRRDLSTFEASIAHYPETTKVAACWLYQYMMARCNGSPAIVAAILKKLNPSAYPNKEQYIYQVTTGRYFKQATGDKAIAVLLEMVESLKRHEMIAEQSGRVAFNEKLSVWKEVRDYIDRKRARDAVCKFGAIEGDTGVGKTAATKHYKLLNNHGSTVRLEAPSNASLARFMMKLGACYNIGTAVRTHERIVKIEENVNDTRTIIVENVQKLYNPKSGPVQPIFSYIQELQDDTDCTFIFTWTPVFRKEMLSGKDASYFKQFVSRIGGIEDVLVLDKQPSKQDVTAIAEQFEVEPHPEALKLLRDWSKQAGPLRILYSRLQKAKVLARGNSVTLDHLEAVNTAAVDARGDEGGDL